MTFPTIRPLNPLRAVYRARRLITVLAAVLALAAVAGGATYALGADLGHDATSQIERGTP